MDRSKKLGHEVDTCVVVRHLARLNGSQKRNGSNGAEKTNGSPEKRQAFDNQVGLPFGVCMFDFV